MRLFSKVTFLSLALPDSASWAEDYGILEGGWLENSDIQEWVETYQQMAYGPIEEDREYEFSAANPFMDNPSAFQIANDSFAHVI